MDWGARVSQRNFERLRCSYIAGAKKSGGAAQRLGRRLTGVHWEVHGPFNLEARTRPTDVFYEAADA